MAAENNWKKLAIERLERIKYPDGRSLASHFGLKVDHLQDYFSAQKPSVRSIYAAIPSVFAYLQKKERWAEKTPSHLLYVQDIRKLFPEAKIVRILRDPRDSIPSVIKNIGLSASLVGEFYRWSSVFSSSNPFFKTDAGSITLKYEDLVENPEQQVSRLCKFLEIEFEIAMLDRAGADHVRVSNETWKRDIDKKITAKNVYGWKNNLNADIARAASLICCEALEELGYPDPIRPIKNLDVFPLGENFGVANEDHIIQCAKKGFRYRSITPTYPRSVKEALSGYPGTLLGDLPLGKKPFVRIRHSVQAIIQIMHRFSIGKPVSIDPDTNLGVGTLNRIIAKFALVFGRRKTFSDF